MAKDENHAKVDGTVILDSGICSIFRKEDVAKRGDMPKYAYRLQWQGWFGELGYETSPARPTEGREEMQTDARIRILQNRKIVNQDVVVLANVPTLEVMPKVGDAITAYEIVRAYHGRDDESGCAITDLTLRRVMP